jgi:hypothetical protein
MHVFVLTPKLDKFTGHIMNMLVAGAEMLHFSLKGQVMFCVEGIVHHGGEYLVRVESISFLLHENSLGIQVVISP